MAEPRPFEEEATLYVLGRLGPIERRRFEKRLKGSPELRILVRELESGAVALAMAVPQRQPPTQMWDRIEEAVAHDGEKRIAERSFLSTLFRSGWAVAACVMIGWLIYALWVNRLASNEASSAGFLETSQSEPEAGTVTHAETPRLLPQPHASTNAVPVADKAPLTRVDEMAALRRELRELEGQMAVMSQTLTQQQTFPSAPGQLAFFQLVSTPADGAAARVVKPPSAELQRALLIGMARELGWLGPSAATSAANAEKQPAPASQEPNKEAAPAETDLGVKFVDFPAEPGGQPPATQRIGSEEAKKLKAILAESPTPSAEPATAGTPENAVSAENVIPAFRSGTNLVLAIDSSVVPVSGADPVTVWTAPSTASFHVRAWSASTTTASESDVPSSSLVPLGTFTMGSVSTVLTIPLRGSFGSAPGPIIFTLGGPTNGYPGGPGVVRFFPSP